MDLRFPFGFAASGTAQATDQDRHIRDLIEQVLLTAPGERVNRPTFGTGSGQLVFQPNSDMLAIAQQKMIQASLQQWLSDLLAVNAVTVENQDAQLIITVKYTVIRTQRTQAAQFVVGSAAS